jgi:hypothetical protein
MENLSREAILRMVGLHDAAHMMRQLNAIQLSMEEEQGQMVTYWTEIRKSEKEISLLAGRVAENETDIGQLQVTAQQITASVSSLTTTVNGHTTSIGQLQITANQLTASVTTIEDTVNGHTTSIGALEIESNRVSNRVTVIEGDYVKEAEITLMVKKDANGYISNALIKADIIDFTFTQSTNFNSGGQTVMNIDTQGNLWIAGEYKGGSITGNITIGTGTNKMYIQPNANGGANLIGMRGSTEVINLGFDGGSGATTSANGILTLGESGDYQTEIHSHFLQIRDGFSSPYRKAQLWTNELIFAEGYAALGITFGVSGLGSSRKIVIRTLSISEWPSLSDVNVGQVYLDNGYLKVRTS